MKFSIHQWYDLGGGICSSSEYIVKEHHRTHTGVRWITIQNIVDGFDTLREAQEKYPKARVHLNPMD